MHGDAFPSVLARSSTSGRQGEGRGGKGDAGEKREKQRAALGRRMSEGRNEPIKAQSSCMPGAPGCRTSPVDTFIRPPLAELIIPICKFARGLYSQRHDQESLGRLSAETQAKRSPRTHVVDNDRGAKIVFTTAPPASTFFSQRPTGMANECLEMHPRQ